MLKKILLMILVVVVPGLVGAFIFSPYGSHEGFAYKMVKHTVEINVPADSVYKYLGNSAHAHDWSVFVDHISPLNADSFPDGAPGSRRRCFQQADEKGTQWDELVTIVEPGKRRQLTIYNLKDFSMQAENLATEQLYSAPAPGKCTLTFTMFFLDGKSTTWDEMKTYIGAFKVKNIFAKNMNNIKRITEEKYGKRG